MHFRLKTKTKTKSKIAAKINTAWGRLTEAWLPISANGPSDHHQHSYNAMHVLMMVGETGVPGVNPRRHGENMQTPHRKDLELPGTTGIRTQGLLAVRQQC